MGRKSNTQKAFEFIIIAALVIIGLVIFIFTKIINAVKDNSSGVFYLIFIICLCAIGFAIFKAIQDNKEQKEENKKKEILNQKFSLEVQALISKIKKYEDKGIEEISNPNINLPKEKIFFQKPFKWQNIGGKKEYEGFLYITDSKIRYIDNASAQLKFEKIMRFTHNKISFNIYPDNDKAITFLPINCEYEYDQMLIVAEFFAIWQMAQGKKIKDFAEEFCKILGLTQLKINDDILYEDIHR